MSFTQKSELPVWLDSKGTINELLFCDEFVEEHPMKYFENNFLDTNGALPADKLRKLISDRICPYVYSGLSRRVGSIYECLKLYCFVESLNSCADEIQLENGVVKASSGRFIERRDICANRLKVRYNNKAAPPRKFLEFLDALLDEEDIKTLQEYLGYCLIPSTRAQAMLFIIGNGGEGKSRLGIVLKAIFGDAMIESALHRLETDRFARANLQNKLLMLDDDLQLEAFSSTGTIKTLVTAETPVDVEQKGVQSYQAMLYARFIAFGNGSPKALYDRSVGFSRRMLILTTKPLDKNRKTDRYIADRMLEEKEGIFLWMLEGLQRLMANHFHFTVSDKAKRNNSEFASDNCNIIDFLADESVVYFGEGKQTSSVDLYKAYFDWCDMNALVPLKRDAFINWLKCNQERYKIQFDYNIQHMGKRVRGFKGIAASSLSANEFVPYGNYTHITHI